IITTFSSLVSRIQQVIDSAVRHNRRVFVVGRNMNEIVRMALELGYLKAPKGVLAKLEEMRGMPHDRIVLITTGSQGEPTSALVRIANKDHKQVHIIPGDTVAISASPIPGNEALVARTIDNLFRQGANVIYSSIMRVHVHGHGAQEELKLLMNVTRPKYFVPVHGEYRHLSMHGQLAENVGIPRQNIFLLEDGDVLEIDRNSARVNGHVQSSNVYVDGLSVGGIDNVVLRDRQMLARDGMVVVILTVNRQTGKLVGRPDIVSRGFVDTAEYKDMLDESCDLVAESFTKGIAHADWNFVSNKTRDILNKYYYEQTKRRPMILPFMVTV
ncbi:MAG TPA: ribonuclease J, partial [Dehalococcoidales bacterium]|nr:ribonuclease J [Dehalococcoidales bacterium]